MSTRNDASVLRGHNPQLTQTERGPQSVEIRSLTWNRFTRREIWRTLAIDIDPQASDGRVVECRDGERAKQVEDTIGAGAEVA